MAERRATNKYYPPDWDPSKGSINKFVGQHPLRDRARKLDQGILIVRFELPYNIWCLGCNNHVGMGVRYNAEKKKIGSYYSTPIWQFRMKCHLCSNWIEIHTDPKNSAYVIESGAKAQTTTWDPAENGTVVLQSEEVSEKLKANPLFRLEHQAVDEAKGASAKTQLTQLQESRDKFWRDPYTMSQRLRKIFRTEKRAREADEKEGQDIKDKNSLSIDILPSRPEDSLEAQLVEFQNPALQTMERKRKAIETRSIFQGQSALGSASKPAPGQTFKAFEKLKKLGGDPFSIRESVGVVVKKPRLTGRDGEGSGDHPAETTAETANGPATGAISQTASLALTGLTAYAESDED